MLAKREELVTTLMPCDWLQVHCNFFISWTLSYCCC